MKKFKIYKGGPCSYYVCANEFKADNWINRHGEVVNYNRETCEFGTMEKAQEILDNYMKKHENPQDFYQIEKCPFGGDGCYVVKIAGKYLFTDGNITCSPFTFMSMADVFLALSKYCQDQKQILVWDLQKKLVSFVLTKNWPIVFENGDQKLNFDKIIEDEVKKQIIIKLKPFHQTN